MAKSWRRQLAESTGDLIGTTGSWARRYAAAFEALGGNGGWMRRVVDGNVDPPGLTGSWDRRLAGPNPDTSQPGGWLRQVVETGEGPDPNPTPPPVDLLFEADFTTGTYEVAGVAAVLGDILVENTDFGGFDPAQDITPQGLTSIVGGTPSFASAWSAMATTAGVTLVFEIASIAATIMYVDLVDVPDFDYEAAIILSDAVSTLSCNADTANGPSIAAGTHKVAMNLSPTRLALSVDGGAVTALPITTVGTNLLGFGVYADQFVRTLNGRALVAEASLPALSTP